MKTLQSFNQVKKLFLIVLMICLSLFQGCSSEKEEPKTQPPQPVKSLGKFDEIDSRLRNIFKEAKLSPEIKDTTLKDNRFSRNYIFKTIIVEAVNKPQVDSVSAMFSPTKNLKENAEILAVVSAIFVAACNPERNKQMNTAYLDNLIEAFKKDETRKFEIGNCSITVVPPISKELPLTGITISPK